MQGERASPIIHFLIESLLSTDSLNLANMSKFFLNVLSPAELMLPLKEFTCFEATVDLPIITLIKFAFADKLHYRVEQLTVVFLTILHLWG